MEICEKNKARIKFLGEMIEAYKKDKNMTQAELREAGGISPTQLCRLKKGDRGVGVGMIYETADALGVSAAELFMYADQEFANEAKRRVIIEVSEGLIRFKDFESIILATNYDKNNLLRFASDIIDFVTKR